MMVMVMPPHHFDGPVEHGLLGTVRNQHPEILDAIRDSRDLDDSTSAKLKAAVDKYAQTFT